VSDDTAVELDESYLDLRIDFSEVEYKDFSPLPAGKYNCNITDAEIRASKSQANRGKPMINYEFTVQDGQYEGRKVYTNACLWPEAIFTLKGILENTGQGNFSGKAEEIIDATVGKEIGVRMAKNSKKDVDNGALEGGSKVQGFYKVGEVGASGAVSGKSSSLLP
jgi:hypothetical protein